MSNLEQTLSIIKPNCERNLDSEIKIFFKLTVSKLLRKN